MFSLIFLTPGRSEQSARTIRSICTPACDAAYSSSITAGWVSALTLIRIRPGLPADTAFATLRISSTMRARRSNGATITLRNSCGLPKPVR